MELGRVTGKTGGHRHGPGGRTPAMEPGRVDREDVVEHAAVLYSDVTVAPPAG